MALAAGSKPVLSIVIPCLGHAQELGYCLRALEIQDSHAPLEVIVVDSAFDDAVKASVDPFPRVKLIRSMAGLSSGAARNVGIRAAVTDVLGLIDADCIPEPGWVRAGLEAVRSGALLAGGCILDVRPWHWIAASDNRLQFANFPRHRPAGLSPYFPSANLFVAREAFQSTGMFDEGAHVAQDVLFTSEVARRWPGRAVFCPQMVVRHFGRARWKDYLEHQRQFGYSRAEFNIQMGRSLSWLGQHESAAGLLVLRRLLYISARVIQWNALDLPRYVLQLPVFLAGLIAWTGGFYQGMRAKRAQ
jgi:glycosyltransferase involved in cell wall biosynthesis